MQPQRILNVNYEQESEEQNVPRQLEKDPGRKRQNLVQVLQLEVQVDQATLELVQEQHEICASSSSSCSEPEQEPQEPSEQQPVEHSREELSVRVLEETL